MQNLPVGGKRIANNFCYFNKNHICIGGKSEFKWNIWKEVNYFKEISTDDDFSTVNNFKLFCYLMNVLIYFDEHIVHCILFARNFPKEKSIFRICVFSALNVNFQGCNNRSKCEFYSISRPWNHNHGIISKN